ncbi:hypothetical protein [Hydrogenimonas sp.]
MKVLTQEHFDRLDRLHLQRYLQQCAKDLEEIDFCNPYPMQKEAYLKFVTHVYEVAKAYGLANQKYAFALMLAWHVRGQNFIREKDIVKLLNSKTIDTHTKYQRLMEISMETMDVYENRKGETDDSQSAR